jgi:hypothetical protein
VRYHLEENITPPHFDINDYYQIMGFNTWTLAGHLNRTHHLDLDISEFAASIPRDLEFFRFVTNLKITTGSFAEILTQEKRLQLFLGLLYRLKLQAPVIGGTALYGAVAYTLNEMKKSGKRSWRSTSYFSSRVNVESVKLPRVFIPSPSKSRIVNTTSVLLKVFIKKIKRRIR